MRLPKTECVYPSTLEEACSCLMQDEGQAKVIAGGTDVVVALKQRRLAARNLVSISCLRELSFISSTEARGLAIGAMTTLSEIARSNAVRETCPSLAVAASRVASPQIRNVGTIGGNIALDSRCWYYNQSSFWRSTRPLCFKTGGDVCHVVKGGKRCYSLVSADTIPALMVAGASVELVSQAGSRALPIEDVYTGDGQTPTTIRTDEILTRVLIPAPIGASIYVKNAYRETIDFPIVGVAAVVSHGSNGMIEHVRLVVGAATTAPVRAKAAERLLIGREASEELLEEAGRVAVKELGAIRNIFASSAYKRRVIGVLVKTAVQQAASISRVNH